MCGGLIDAPDPPKPPPAPKAPTPVAPENTKKAVEAGDEERRRRAAAGGRQSTILTGARGALGGMGQRGGSMLGGM